MIWANHAGGPSRSVQVGTVTTAGGTWDVWFGNSGWNVISYVRTSAAASLNFKLTDFYDDAVQRGYAQKAWYLTSVQAGFEPWSGGKGLALSGFAVTQDGSTSSPTPTTATPTIPVVTPTDHGPHHGADHQHQHHALPRARPPAPPPTRSPSPGTGASSAT